MLIPITNIQRFCMHDGPGIRTTVFFKGCPLRCRWCHNPETHSVSQQIFYTPERCIGCGLCAGACRRGAHIFSGGHVFERSRCASCGSCAEVCPSKALETACRLMSVDEIMHEVLRDSAFYGESGGLTLSGGEPMAHPEAAFELLRAARSNGIGTAVETCGFFPRELLLQLCSLSDLLLWDVKDTDPARHLENTGAELSPIIENLREADRLGARIVLRCIMIQGVNFTSPDCEHVRRLFELRGSLSHCQGVDIIPYHPMGGSKYARLGLEYGCGRELIPSREDVDALRALFRSGS